MSDSPVPIKDVVSQFNQLEETGSNIGFKYSDALFPNRRYIASLWNGFGRDNHFQGLVRRGSKFYISGGFPPKNDDSGADLFEMDYHPEQKNEVVLRDQLDNKYWHPGGLGLVGSTLIVPLEDEVSSVLRFYDVDKKPEGKFFRFEKAIERSKYKGGAAAISRLANDHVVCAVWSDSDRPKETRKLHLDFYVFKGATPAGEYIGPITYYPSEGSEMSHKFQSMTFIWEESNAREKLYLAMFENTTKAAPVKRGDNIGRLFEIKIPDKWLNDPKIEDVPEISFKAKKKFDYHRKWCNMDAGSCAFVDEDRKLTVYSCFHFRKGGLVRCVEFKTKWNEQPDTGILSP